MAGASATCTITEPPNNAVACTSAQASDRELEKNEAPVKDHNAPEQAKSLYPRRNVERKNYKEEEIPDSDHYLCKFTIWIDQNYNHKISA